MEEIKNTQELNDVELKETVGGAGQSRWITYTILRGDTLAKIASRYHVTVGKLVQWNNILDPDRIKAGNRLKIYTNA